MAKKLFIGNIDWNVKGEELRSLFEQYGEVEESIIITDKFSGRSKGFGFVTMANDGDADSAISALNDYELNGRPIVVNEARPPKPRFE